LVFCGVAGLTAAPCPAAPHAESHARLGEFRAASHAALGELHAALDAARLLGKPERTVRRWAARGRLPATRTIDGWQIELSLDELRLMPGFNQRPKLIDQLYFVLRNSMDSNGVETARYQPVHRVPRDAPLVFLGRLEPIKGPHHAIAIARAAGRRLVIAGNRVSSSDEYFERRIAPHLAGDDVVYMGPVDDEHKSALLGAAAALLTGDEAGAAGSGDPMELQPATATAHPRAPAASRPGRRLLGMPAILPDARECVRALRARHQLGGPPRIHLRWHPREPGYDHPGRFAACSRRRIPGRRQWGRRHGSHGVWSEGSRP